MIKIGQCQVCKEFFPPDFTIIIDVDPKGEELYKCVFCETGKDSLGYDTGGGTRDYTKKECIKDYKELIGKLKGSPAVSKTLEDKAKE